MPAPHWIEKLRQHWKVDTIWQVLIILTVFACTGFTIYFLKRPLLGLIAGEKGKTIFAGILYYLLILPVYNAILLTYGFLFGQFKFFWAFEKRLFSKMFVRAKK